MKYIYVLFYLLILPLFHYICFFVLHADKAKGLQINLSEALQGKKKS